MANRKITELTNLQQADNEDLLVIVDSSEDETKNIKVGDLIVGNEISISPTEPTGEERNKVWIKKGKNLLNKSKLQNLFMPSNSTSEVLEYNSGTYTTNWIKCLPNTQYTISGYNRTRCQLKSTNGTITFIDSATITTNADTEYFRFYCWSTDGGSIDSANIQIEQGSTATTFEEYVDEEINIINDNNNYENFLAKLDIDISGLDNDHVSGNDGYGGLVKKTIRANQTTYTFNVPNNQSGGFIRSAIVTCGNKGIMFVCWTGNNASSVPPTIVWKSFNDNVTFNHNNGVLTFTFDTTLYGSVNVLFMN